MPQRKTKSRSMVVKKILKRELASRNKYKTTYKDIKKYFNMINKVIFNNKLSPFNDVKIKEIRDGRPNGKSKLKKFTRMILRSFVTD
jgi:hypothetical protein